MKQLLSQSTNVPTSATPPDHVCGSVCICAFVWGEKGESIKRVESRIKEVRQRSLPSTQMLHDCFSSCAQCRLCNMITAIKTQRLAEGSRLLNRLGGRIVFFPRDICYSRFVLVQPWPHFTVLMQLLWNPFLVRKIWNQDTFASFVCLWLER